MAAFFTTSEMPSEIEVQTIISNLDRLSDIEKYPNPDEVPTPFQHPLFQVFENFDHTTFFNSSSPGRLSAYKTNAIANALSTGTAILLKPRIFINLGHLEFSINRIMDHIDHYNTSRGSGDLSAELPLFIRGIKREYYIWLHFRLYFTLIDILRTYPLEKIYYKEMYDSYKELAGDSW